MDGPMHRPDGSRLLRREAVHAALLASDSATAVLEGVSGGPVHVQRLAPDETGAGPVTPELQAGDGEPVVRRRVHLMSGAATLSTATLAYLPQRLPPALAQVLATTNQPFGQVLSGLGLRRTTLVARLCGPDEPFALHHRAVLSLPDGARVALVDEHYSWTLFAAS